MNYIWHDDIDFAEIKEPVEAKEKRWVNLVNEYHDRMWTLDEMQSVMEDIQEYLNSEFPREKKMNINKFKFAFDLFTRATLGIFDAYRGTQEFDERYISSNLVATLIHLKPQDNKKQESD